MKQSEIKELSVDQLQEQLTTLKKSYSDLKMAHAISPLENPLEIKSVRKTIARLMTEINSRESQQ